MQIAFIWLRTVKINKKPRSRCMSCNSDKVLYLKDFIWITELALCTLYVKKVISRRRVREWLDASVLLVILDQGLLSVYCVWVGWFRWCFRVCFIWCSWTGWFGDWARNPVLLDYPFPFYWDTESSFVTGWIPIGPSPAARHWHRVDLYKAGVSV